MTSNEFITEILPLAIAGSCSPTTLVIGILILTSKNRPWAKAAVFTLGNLVVLTAVGVAALLFAHATTVPLQSHASGPSTADASIDVFVGALLLALTLRHALRPQPPADDAPPKWLSGFDRLGYGRSFLIGMGIMAINFSTLVVYLPAIRYVGKYAHDLTNELVLFAVVVLIVESWMLAALALSAAAPERSARLLRGLNAWLGRHGRTICLVLFAVFGAYFLIKGLTALL